MTTASERGDSVAAYEAGRRRGLAECPCGRNPGAADLLDDDGYAAGQQQGAWAALLACLWLLVAATALGRRR